MVWVDPYLMKQRPPGTTRREWARVVNCRRKLKLGSEALAERKAADTGKGFYQCKVCEFWHLYTKRGAK